MRSLLKLSAVIWMAAFFATNVQTSGAAEKRAVQSSDNARPLTRTLPLTRSIDQDVRTRRNDPGTGKVTGGVPVAPGSFADVVAVTKVNSSTLECTGTAIRPDVVLSAAHCGCGGITGRVYLGDSARGGGRFVAVKTFRIWASCRQKVTPARDLMLLFLDSPITSTPRRLASASLIAQAKTFRVVGFGATDFNARNYPDEKREAPVIAASPDCTGTIDDKGGGISDRDAYGCIPKREIVAGRPGGVQDSCNGDSGGPLFVAADGTGFAANDSHFLLAGVTSRPTQASEHACGDGGIYERIDGPALRWVDETMKQVRGH